MEEVQLTGGVHLRGDDVEHVVAVEVVRDHATGEPAVLHAPLRRDVGEARELLARRERLHVDAPLLGHLVLLAERHVREVEQPARRGVGRVLREEVREHADRTARPLLVHVPARLANR